MMMQAAKRCEVMRSIARAQASIIAANPYNVKRVGTSSLTVGKMVKVF